MSKLISKLMSKLISKLMSKLMSKQLYANIQSYIAAKEMLYVQSKKVRAVVQHLIWTQLPAA